MTLRRSSASRWTSVDYNELVDHPRAVVLRLCKFLEIKPDAHLEARLAGPRDERHVNQPALDNQMAQPSGA